jgi:plasmid maintenance system antidote protein VapI
MVTLKDWMTARGIGSGELARMLGITPSAVSQFVTGARPISDAFRWRFARKFGVKEAESVFSEARPEPDTSELEPAH